MRIEVLKLDHFPAPGETGAPCDSCGHAKCKRRLESMKAPCPVCEASIGSGPVAWVVDPKDSALTIPAHRSCAERTATKPTEPEPDSTEGILRAAALEVAALVVDKQAAYGDAFGKTGMVMAILYPEGLPLEAMPEALTVVRVVDKLFRIATAAGNPDPMSENPWKDINGYSLLELTRADRMASEAAPEKVEPPEPPKTFKLENPKSGPERVKACGCDGYDICTH